MTTPSQQSVLLIIGGGIAAYKALELIRLLTAEGFSVSAIMTKAAHQFVTPLSVASLTGAKVHDDLFSLTDETEMGHIELSRAADLIVVAPATADLMAKAAHGLADDLASTALLATNKPVLMAPAMNVRMWEHQATRRSLAALKEDGVRFVGPNQGDMACGEFGYGRMAEPVQILDAIKAALKPACGPLAGRRVLVTAGPTHEPIDPVRYIANRSSGKQGYAIAEAAAALGAQTVLVSGPVTLAPPPGVEVVPVETAREMLQACEGALPCDIAVFVAAVADWRVETAAKEKIKKEAARPPALRLSENPDILKTIATRPKDRPGLVVGFAAETEALIAHAQAKLKRKGCDLIVANDVSPAGKVMNGERNRVHLVCAQGVETWPEMSKREVARRLMEQVARHFASKAKAAE